MAYICLSVVSIQVSFEMCKEILQAGYRQKFNGLVDLVLAIFLMSGKTPEVNFAGQESVSRLGKSCSLCCLERIVELPFSISIYPLGIL